MTFRYQSEANLAALLAQNEITEPDIWAREALRSFVQFAHDVARERDITVLNAWEINEHAVDRIIERVGTDVPDFESLLSEITDEIELTSALGPGNGQRALTAREQAALVDNLIDLLDQEIKDARRDHSRTFGAPETTVASPETVVRPNSPVRDDLRRAQIIDVSSLRHGR